MGLERAIEFFKTQNALAKRLGVSSMTISQWKRRGVPAVRAKEIEIASDGKVLRHEIRPDIFDPPSSEAAA